jgi:hypothetical protein
MVIIMFSFNEAMSFQLIGAEHEGMLDAWFRSFIIYLFIFNCFGLLIFFKLNKNRIQFLLYYYYIFKNKNCY